MKTVVTRLNRWDGGMVNDPRVRLSNVARVITNFDILTNRYELTPYRSSEDGDSSSSTSQKQNFCIGYWTPTPVWKLFALGVVSGSGKAEILMKDLTTGASNDLDDATWATPANNQSASGSTSFNLFVYYKKTGKIYGAKAGSTIWSFTPDGSTAFDDTHHSLSYTNISQGLVHSKDDVLYIPYDNKIATNNNGTWNDTALTLPSDVYITSICEYGNYLAIAAAPLSGIGVSNVYLWNRDTSTTLTQEKINWGEGVLKIVEEIGGELIGVALSGSNSTRLSDRVLFKKYTGYSVERIMELAGGTSTVLLSCKQKINNRLYFMMSITLNGSLREGVWSVGKFGAGDPFAIAHERTPNNDTALTSGVLKNFIYVGDYLFQSYVSNSTYGLSKTDDQANYSHTSIVETITNPGLAPQYMTTLKQIKTIGLTYTPLLAAGQAVLKYKVDGGSYTTVFTDTTDSSQNTQVQDAGGTQFTSGRNFEYRIEGTGGMEPLELAVEYEILEDVID